MSIEELIKFVDDKPMAHPLQLIQAYEVYMRDQGYRWSGINGERWVK